MSNCITENDIEQIAIELLQEQGYNYSSFARSCPQRSAASLAASRYHTRLRPCA